MLSQKLFAKSMTMMCEIYQRELTDALFEAYWMVLNGMNDAEFSASIQQVLTTRTYATLPKPAEIIEYAKPDLEAIATIAWGDVERAIYKAGKYASVAFEDPVVNSVIDALGGWVWLCSQDISEMKWIRKDFPKLYTIHSKLDSHPTHLIGISERENGCVTEIPMVKAGYVLQVHQIVPALNPARSVNELMIGLSNQVRVS